MNQARDGFANPVGVIEPFHIVAAGQPVPAGEMAGDSVHGAPTFVPRCPLSTEVCVEQRPPLRLVEGSLTACHHAEQLKDRGAPRHSQAPGRPLHRGD